MMAKIISHSGGLGVPSPGLVRQRAHEIARIQGHRHATDEDRRQAICELHGGHDHLNGLFEDALSDQAPMLDMRHGGEIDHGHQTPKRAIDDTDHVLEELVAEGMDEASHEQMLAASKWRRFR